MSKSTIHAYEITFINVDLGEGVKVGTVIMDKGHIRAQHEPARDWQYLKNDGKVKGMTATHIGEWEKVKKYVGGWKDANNMKPVLKGYARGEWDGGQRARELFGEESQEVA